MSGGWAMTVGGGSRVMDEKIDAWVAEAVNRGADFQKGFADGCCAFDPYRAMEVARRLPFAGTPARIGTHHGDLSEVIRDVLAYAATVQPDDRKEGFFWGAHAAAPQNLKSEIREAFTSWWKATGR